jgi:hypothetical protein
LPHDLDPKAFYSERDKFGLEGMTPNINHGRSIRRDPARCSRKDKESTFSF